MTHQEAIIAFNKVTGGNEAYADHWIQGFIALGMLKLDDPPPPKTPMEKLEDSLRRRYFTDNNIADLKLALGSQGLEVTEKPITKR